MSDTPPTPDDGELKLALTDAAHLFVAPPANPLSPGDSEALGVAGVDYLLGQLYTDKAKRRARTVALVMPPDKAAGADAGRLTLALHRQATLRREEQRRELRHTYRYGWKVAGIALVLLAVCIALSSLFASEFTDFMRPLPREVFEYGFEIIGWVVLWHPIDVLAFSPLAIRARIAALDTLAASKVVVRSATATP
jgi:hypothetical protein